MFHAGLKRTPSPRNGKQTREAWNGPGQNGQQPREKGELVGFSKHSCSKAVQQARWNSWRFQGDAVWISCEPNSNNIATKLESKILKFVRHLCTFYVRVNLLARFSNPFLQIHSRENFSARKWMRSISVYVRRQILLPVVSFVARSRPVPPT